mmetsp:Transcript_15626/g.40409  ORF Transcript_15626/g.40409 Transcript_15626/m.40409 type:complete len:201 (-) Transcript_15626:1002-1604(-)
MPRADAAEQGLRVGSKLLEAPDKLHPRQPPAAVEELALRHPVGIDEPALDLRDELAEAEVGEVHAMIPAARGSPDLIKVCRLKAVDRLAHEDGARPRRVAHQPLGRRVVVVEQVAQPVGPRVVRNPRARVCTSPIHIVPLSERCPPVSEASHATEEALELLASHLGDCEEDELVAFHDHRAAVPLRPAVSVEGHGAGARR